MLIPSKKSPEPLKYCLHIEPGFAQVPNRQQPWIMQHNVGCVQTLSTVELCRHIKTAIPTPFKQHSTAFKLCPTAFKLCPTAFEQCTVKTGTVNNAHNASSPLFESVVRKTSHIGDSKISNRSHRGIAPF